MSDPLPVLPLDYAGPDSSGPPIRPFLRNSILVGCLILLLGTIAIWIQVETVLFSGPALLAWGFVIIIAALKPPRYHAITLGASHIAVCFTFVILVNAFNWSPDDAKWPFALMSTLYAVGSSIYAARILHPRIVPNHI